MEVKPQSAAGEWRAHWPLVLASTAGFSFATIAAATIGLFMDPLSREFNWTRAEISFGLTMFALIAVPLSPFVGALIDRWGSRRLAIPGVVLSALAFAAFCLMNGTLALWYAAWLAFSLVALGIKGTVWTAAVSSVFSRGRGLALAATLSGSAVTMTLAPIVTQWLIDGYGWRSAYVWLAAGWGGFVLATVIPFFFDTRDGRGISAQANVPSASGALLTGLSVREASRDGALIRIGLATLVTVTMVSAITVHQVPLLAGKGLARGTAAMVAGAAGIASIAGKLVTGWMLDRWHGAWIGGVSLTLPALSYLLLLPAKVTVATALLAIVIIGYSNGAFVQISAYMTGRYGGLRHFGKIYGMIASITALGAGIGPPLAGFVYDRFGSYAPFLAAGVPLALLSGLLLARLAPYPDWQARAAAAPPP